MSESAALSFQLPSGSARDEFERLPDSARYGVRMKLRCMELLHRLGPKKAMAEIRRFVSAEADGFSKESLYRALRAFKVSHGDWRVCIDFRKIPAARGQPQEFIDFWRSLHDENKRNLSGAQARSVLVRRWQAGEAIDGYGSWREHWQRMRSDVPIPAECPEDFIPHGWDYANLMRLTPPPAETALAKLGEVAASALLPHIPQTREGMRFLEWVTLDDVETDFLVCVDDVDKPVVLRCIVAMDIATGVCLRLGTRPSLPRDDGSTQGLLRRDTLVIVAGMIRTFGFPTQYRMNIVVERGTASISQEDARALQELSGGNIVVHWTNMQGGRALPGGFRDKRIGSPTGKAWLESSLNLLHNMAGALPGQKGASYALRPAELEGRSKELAKLVQAGRVIPANLRLALRYPFLHLHEANVEVRDIAVRMNGRREHELEGFESVRQWRWRHDAAAPWRGMADYPVALPPGAEGDLEIRAVKESPMERAGRLMLGFHFERMPEASVRWFLEKHHDTVTVTNGMIEIDIDRKTYRFYRQGSPLLVEGAKYLAYYSRTDLVEEAKSRASVDESSFGWIYLTDGRGAYRGKLPLYKAALRGDVKALAERLADKERELAHVRDAVMRRSAGKIGKRLEDVEANIEVFRNATAMEVVPAPEAGDCAVAAVTAGLAGAEIETEHAAAGRSRRRRSAEELDRAATDVFASMSKK
jgi:hypothetical protein